MKVVVDVPDKTFWRLAGEAESSGMKVGQWLLRLASPVEGPSPEAAVSVRCRRGMCDADIARELGWTNQRVAVLRRQLRLPANRRKRVAA